MQVIPRSEMFSYATECYGCGDYTSNMSGMCSKCGGDADDTLSLPMVRERFTLDDARLMIEG